MDLNAIAFHMKESKVRKIKLKKNTQISQINQISWITSRNSFKSIL